jgi:hypothetical protein
MQVDTSGEKIVWGSTENKSSSKEKDDNKSINLSLIIEVTSGANTQALSHITNPAKAACCFSVYSEDRSLDVEMSDVVSKNIWVLNLNEICFANKLISLPSSLTW